MTAVVGILNKQAVAIAADSAVTIAGEGGRKILNKANKVFALSKVHPVGIMIYNSASFMSTPWETIIKVYRKNLSDRFFSTLDEYRIDFIDFIKSKNYYADYDTQILVSKYFIIEIIDSIINKVAQNNIPLTNSPTKANKAKFLQKLEDQIDAVSTFWKSSSEIC